MSEQVSNIIKQGHQTWSAWNELTCSARAEILLRWADEIAKQPCFGMKASEMVKYQVKQGIALIGDGKIMPGPTGESNELYASGRGVFIIHSDPEAPVTALVGMLATALLAGNAIIFSLPKVFQQVVEKTISGLLHAGVAKGVVQAAPVESLEVLISDASIAGVAYAGNKNESVKLNKLLAVREGLLAQLIIETELTLLGTITDNYFVLRFITEKTRTINITAVGGNAVLLELGCGDQ